MTITGQVLPAKANRGRRRNGMQTSEKRFPFPEFIVKFSLITLIFHQNVFPKYKQPAFVHGRILNQGPGESLLDLIV